MLIDGALEFIEGCIEWVDTEYIDLFLDNLLLGSGINFGSGIGGLSESW